MGRRATGAGDQAGWPVRAAFAVEIAAVAVLAYALAQLVWVGYPPLADVPRGLGAPPAAAPAPPPGGLNPFRPSAVLNAAAQDPLVDAPPTTLNLLVVGMRAEGQAGAGSAIIQTPDNQQRLYTVGDMIVDGVTLAAVEPHRIVIMRDGVLESVLLENRASLISSGGDPVAAESLTAATAAGPAVGRVSGEALLNDVAPAPHADGVVVNPRSDGLAFAAAGFQPSDVVQSVNGVSVSDVEGLSASLAGVGPGSTVVVEARRADAPVTIRFVLE